MQDLRSLEKTSPRSKVQMEESELGTSMRHKPVPEENYMLSPSVRSEMMGALDPRELGIQK